MRGAEANYLAVVVAAMVPIVIGALWYSPLMFGEVWARAHGFSEDRLLEIGRHGARTVAVSFVCYLVMAVVLSRLISTLGLSSASGGALLGLLLWLGFLATMGLTAFLFSDKPILTYLLDAAYQLMYAAAMGALLASWR
ncbi:MAG: DUF1761 domain-containing protein [Gemmatimonadota bacterium]